MAERNARGGSQIQISCTFLSLSLRKSVEVHTVNLSICQLAKSQRFAVEFLDINATDILVHFKAPSGCLYSGYVWEVETKLPEGYPRAPPKFYFKNQIFHPNIDPKSGLVCVDILQANVWPPSKDLCFVFEEVIPELLRKPDPDAGFHMDARNLLKKNKKAFEKTVRGIHLSLSPRMEFPFAQDHLSRALISMMGNKRNIHTQLN